MMNELAHHITVSCGDMTLLCNKILVSSVVTVCKISNPTNVSRTSQPVASSSAVHMLSASCTVASMALVRLDPLTPVSTLKTDTRVRKRVRVVQPHSDLTTCQDGRVALLLSGAEWLSAVGERHDGIW